jgi:hypothetical protein
MSDTEQSRSKRTKKNGTSADKLSRWSGLALSKNNLGMTTNVFDLGNGDTPKKKGVMRCHEVNQGPNGVEISASNGVFLVEDVCQVGITLSVSRLHGGRLEKTSSLMLGETEEKTGHSQEQVGPMR